MLWAALLKVKPSDNRVVSHFEFSGSSASGFRPRINRQTCKANYD
jgi:hypothetical protein